MQIERHAMLVLFLPLLVGALDITAASRMSCTRMKRRKVQTAAV